eukprot:8886192-Alexandrium_andersonii.AAC.1
MIFGSSAVLLPVSIEVSRGAHRRISTQCVADKLSFSHAPLSDTRAAARRDVTSSALATRAGPSQPR